MRRSSPPLLGLGDVALKQGDYVMARALNEERLHIERDLGNTLGVAHALGRLGHAAWALDDYFEAMRQWEESLRLSRGMGAIRTMLHKSGERVRATATVTGVC
jgi:hypothetical protein